MKIDEFSNTTLDGRIHCSLSTCKARLFFLLLLLGTSAHTIEVGRADEIPSHEPPINSTLLQKLHVPKTSDSWEIDALFDGYRVKLKLPHQLDMINNLPPEIQSKVRQRIKYRARNIQVLRRVTKEMDRILNGNQMIQPALHDQTLEQVVMSLPPNRSINPRSPLALYEPILNALPDYSKVDIFLPDKAVLQVSLRLRALGIEHRVKLHGVHEFDIVENGVPLHHHTTRWTRDLFWTSADENGRSLLLLPLAFYQINDLSRTDNGYVSELDGGKHKVVRVPLFFKGGNLLVGVINGRRILFVGKDELQLNNEFFYNAFFYFPPEDEVLGLLTQLAGVDEVRIIPNSKHLFHLDMVMSVLKTGVVAVIKPVDANALNDDDKRVIAEVRQTLEELEFGIVDVPTLSDWVRTFRSPVNIVPFTHRNNGSLNAIVPLFQDTKITFNGKPYSLQRKIKQAYKNAGLETTFVLSNFHHFGGNVHCSVLPLK